MRRTRCAILLTHGHWDHVLGVAELADATGAPVYLGAAELPELESGLAEWMGIPSPLASCPTAARRRRDARTWPGSRSRLSRRPATGPGTWPSPAAAACSRATCSSAARSGAPISPAATGTRCWPRSRAPARALPARDGRLLRPWPRDDARRRAAPQPVPGRVDGADELRGAQGNPRRPARASGRAGSGCWTRPSGSATPTATGASSPRPSRRPSCSRAARARPPTSSPRRCTPSRIGAGAR